MNKDEIREMLMKLAGKKVWVKLPNDHPVGFEVSGELEYRGKGEWTLKNGCAHFFEDCVESVYGSFYPTILLEYK